MCCLCYSLLLSTLHTILATSFRAGVSSPIVHAYLQISGCFSPSLVISAAVLFDIIGTLKGAVLLSMLSPVRMRSKITTSRVSASFCSNCTVLQGRNTSSTSQVERSAIHCILGNTQLHSLPTSPAGYTQVRCDCYLHCTACAHSPRGHADAATNVSAVPVVCHCLDDGGWT